MAERTHVNLHLTDDTRINVSEFRWGVCLSVGQSASIYLDSQDQLAELMQACDQAAKHLA